MTAGDGSAEGGSGEAALGSPRGRVARLLAGRGWALSPAVWHVEDGGKATGGVEVAGG